MDLNLTGKVAVVTGAAAERGIGAGIARALAREGVDVACVDVDLEGAQNLAAGLEATGRRSLALRVDQSDPDAVRDGARSVSGELGPIDILINNAAVFRDVCRLDKMDVSAWDREVTVNLSGAYYWTRAVFPGMLDRGWGRIISISSVVGLIGSPGQASYSAAKAGLGGLMKTVALEGARSGVIANTLYLGFIDTSRAHESVRPEVFERIVRKSAVRRLGTIDEVGSVVAFLASDMAGFIVGADIVVDGGQSLWVL